jgi:hypothetical protein
MKTRPARTSAGPIPFFMEPPLRVARVGEVDPFRAHPPSDDDVRDQHRGAARKSSGHDSWERTEHRVCQQETRTGMPSLLRTSGAAVRPPASAASCPWSTARRLVTAGCHSSRPFEAPHPRSISRELLAAVAGKGAVDVDAQCERVFAANHLPARPPASGKSGLVS